MLSVHLLLAPWWGRSLRALPATTWARVIITVFTGPAGQGWIGRWYKGRVRDHGVIQWEIGMSINKRRWSKVMVFSDRIRDHRAHAVSAGIASPLEIVTAVMIWHLNWGYQWLGFGILFITQTVCGSGGTCCGPPLVVAGAGGSVGPRVRRRAQGHMGGLCVGIGLMVGVGVGVGVGRRVALGSLPLLESGGEISTRHSLPDEVSDLCDTSIVVWPWVTGLGFFLPAGRVSVLGGAFSRESIGFRGPAPVWIERTVLCLSLASLVLPHPAFNRRERLPAKTYRGCKVGSAQQGANRPTILESVEWLPSTRPGTWLLRTNDDRNRIKAFGGRGMCPPRLFSPSPRRGGITYHCSHSPSLSSIRSSFPTMILQPVTLNTGSSQPHNFLSLRILDWFYILAYEDCNRYGMGFIKPSQNQSALFFRDLQAKYQILDSQ